MVGWSHRLHGHEYEQAPGNGDGLGSVVCHSPSACNELDTTWRLNNNKEQVSREPLRHETDEFLSGAQVGKKE